MKSIHCPACGAEILSMADLIISDMDGATAVQHKIFYDLILKEEKRLQKLDIVDNYRCCKALAACFELQDYLANCIAVESHGDC